MNGAWPGGPRRTSDVALDDPPPPRLRTMQERVISREDRTLARRRRHRTRRARMTGVVAAVVATAAGFALGRQAERSAADVAEAQSRAREAEEMGNLGRLLGGQADRVIQQMWLTELAETQLQQP